MHIFCFHNTTNRPLWGGWCGRDKWAYTKCQRARGRNAKWAVYKCQMLVVQIPNAVNANAY